MHSSQANYEGAAEHLKENQERLLKLCTKIFERITAKETMDVFPRELRSAQPQRSP